MPQQTKTEALEELARLIRRDIMNGTARLNETWWFDDDTKMQDRIAHVLLDYSDEEKPTELDVAGYNAEIDRLTEKCAALVVERNSLAAENAGLHRQCDDLRISMGRATPLRIDTDMSDPQPGKLLVVRLMTSDAGLMRDGYSVEAEASQWVGFLVETPAVEVKGQTDGWVVYDAVDTVEPFRFKFGWQRSSHSTNSPPFESRDDAVAWLEFIKTKSYFPIPLAAAHAIEAATKEGGQ